MSTEYRIEVGSHHLVASDELKKGLEAELQGRFGDEIKFEETPVSRELQDILTATTTVIGTIGVSNPDLLIALIRLLYDRDEIFIKQIIDSEDISLQLANVNINILQDADIEFNLIKKVSEEVTLVDPADNEALRELARLADERRESGQALQRQAPLRLHTLEKDDDNEDSE